MNDDDKVIICSGKSASLSLDSALAASGKRKWSSVREKFETAKVMINEAVAEAEEG